ncbi:TauD/TfdA family dioxygenase [Streptomyces sp. UNOC14_S4]|uniref:TauD/TfdA family dioxygenase n=1 Tax=Streptomyces sp. UNOC14_S4 TaxID=2872340 RepID=UPI001E2CCC5B|nr:TauD/TfdA family dioxygenase [Streptomyces sp. UNOC14_S4]MCC3772653.1 TauD/TfdA family dioxygenase [Streptomyces sp. UNOC14_S4]
MTTSPGATNPGDSATPTWRLAEGKPATTDVPRFDTVEEACAWLSGLGTELRDRLREHGALYFRGLPVRSVEDFARVRDVLMPQRTPYREKATPRSSFGDDVYSSTDLPPSQPIRMHNENSYTLTFPGLLLFACLTAPAEGGATPVADCREVLRRLPAGLVERMRAHGWALTRHYSEHISVSWQNAFATTDRAEVEKYCADNLVSCAWGDDGTLRTAQLRPGIVRHPATGDEVWFNHLAFWSSWSLDEELREALTDEFGPDGLPFETDFADDLPFTREELDLVNAAYEAATVRRTWQTGDVLLVDNILTSHGRDPFRGDRKIVVAMGSPVDLADCSPTVAPAAQVRRATA